jgi:hypothetical protein
MAAGRRKICKRPGCRRWVRRAPKAKCCSDECRVLFHVERRRPQLRSSSRGLISCRICGLERHILARHLRASHGLSPAEYLRLHPGAPVVSEHYRGISADRKLDEQGSRTGPASGSSAPSNGMREGAVSHRAQPNGGARSASNSWPSPDAVSVVPAFPRSYWCSGRGTLLWRRPGYRFARAMAAASASSANAAIL